MVGLSNRARLGSALVAACLALAPLATGPGCHSERAARPAVFELRALGVLGGDCDTNLSSYLLGRPGVAGYPVMIDGGSIVPGIVRWKEATGELEPGASWSETMRVVTGALEPLEAFLLTHAHLDHLGGFVQKSTLDVMRARRGRPPLDIVALPETIQALEEHVFTPPLWVDFTRIPEDAPALRYRPLAPGAGARRVGPFSVRTLPLAHPVPSAAFLVSSGDDHYLHLGDTGPSRLVWDVASPLLFARALRAVAVEVSFSWTDEALASHTGHLTRSSLLLELNKLTDAYPEGIPLPPAELISDGVAYQIAQEMAPRMRGCKVIVLHIKAMDHERIVRELEPLKRGGLDVVVPRQGEAYRF